MAVHKGPSAMCYTRGKEWRPCELFDQRMKGEL